MEQKVNEILKALNIEEEVVAVFPYGSHVYGTANQQSDKDYIIVAKGAMLSNGAFRNNAISSEDRSIQAVMYSRGGFQDAINNFEIGALECLSLPDDEVLLKKWPFRIQKWDEKQLVKKIIQKASASWHAADKQAKGGFKIMARRGIFHALRILDFGYQLKKNQRIVDFSSSNSLRDDIQNMENFDTRSFIPQRDKLMKKLRDE